MTNQKKWLEEISSNKAVNWVVTKVMRALDNQTNSIKEQIASLTTELENIGRQSEQIEIEIVKEFIPKAIELGLSEETLITEVSNRCKTIIWDKVDREKLLNMSLSNLYKEWRQFKLWVWFTRIINSLHFFADDSFSQDNNQRDNLRTSLNECENLTEILSNFTDKEIMYMSSSSEKAIIKFRKTIEW